MSDIVLTENCTDSFTGIGNGPQTMRWAGDTRRLWFTR